MKKKSVLVIAGSDSSSGAGIQADLKTLSAFNVYAATVLTALTAQNTIGVHDVFNVPKKFIKKQIEVIIKDLDITYVKIGMLSTVSIVKTINQCLDEYLPKVSIILDPVMVAKGGCPLLEKSAIKHLKKSLLLKSFLITPNLLEAEEILGCSINSIDAMEKSLEKFKKLGFTNVLLKGGHLYKEKEIVTDFLYQKGSVYKFSSKRIKTKNTHGTGCSLASAVTANLYLGKSLKESVKLARNFVNKGIKKSFSIGSGHNPINHFIKN